MLFLISAVNVYAGDIALTVENTTRVANRRAVSEFHITNKGTDIAWNVSLQTVFLNQQQIVSLGREIAPGATTSAVVYLDLPPEAKGEFPVYGTVVYQDAKGKWYSHAVLAIARTSHLPATLLAMKVFWNDNAEDRPLRVELSTTQASLTDVALTCFVPDDLSVSPRRQEVVLYRGKASVDFHLGNRTGTPGSRYEIFVIAEYIHKGMHRLAHERLTVPVDRLRAAEGGRFRRGDIIIVAIALFAVGFVVISLMNVRVRARVRALFGHHVFDILTLLAIEIFILYRVSPGFLFTDTITTGGDTASHYYTLEYLRNSLLPRGMISGWTPGNYAGFPILLFYFPLPFLVMSALGTLITLKIAFKWITLSGTFLLPVSAYVMLRMLRCPFPGPAVGAAFTLPFLFNGGNSMWGGNIQSTLAGEFTYSLSLSLSLILLGSLYRGCTENRHVVRNAIFVFLVGFSHGYTLLFVEAMSLFFLITGRGFMQRLVYLFKVYALGFLLLAFWLVPLLSHMNYTTPYHLAWVIYSLKEVFPEVLLPVIILAGCSTLGILAWSIRTGFAKREDEGRAADTPASGFVPSVHVLGFLWFGVLVSGILFVMAPKLGVVDIRYVPCGQLMACLIAAYGVGWLVGILKWRGLMWACLVFIVGATLMWTDRWEGPIRDWTKWNYEGFEAKAAWTAYKEINGSLRGSFQDPRVVYEHSSLHNSFGSVRAFESLPLFSGRATLEGLYMQASPSAPFVFYVQSEVSKEQSCPFRQYHCTTIDFGRAKRHLELFNVRDLILVSPEAKAAIRGEPSYSFRKTVGDYEMWRLTRDEYDYVVPLRYEPVVYFTQDWKTDSYRWFMRDDLSGVHLVFNLYPHRSGKERLLFKAAANSLENVEMIPIDVGSCRVRETILNDEILIETNWIGKPLLVKVSYHPNWRVEGAERIYLVSPAFMLIYPDREHVRLYYAAGLPERGGAVLTGIGLLILLLNIPLPGKARKTAWSLVAARFGVTESLEPSLRWDPSPVMRRRILISILAVAALVTGWTCYRVYADDPQRWFNAGIKLKDTQRYGEARENFRRVIAHTGPVSGLAAESAYYIATSHYLEKDDPAAIQAFQELIRMFPRSSWVPEAQYHIGLSYLRMGQLPEAFAQMRSVIARYPHTRWAGYATDRLKK